MWKWQPWTLIVAAGVAITIHCVGYTQLSAAYLTTNSSSWEDGMKIIRFVDAGYYVIFGIGFLLLTATAVVRSSNTKNQAQQGAHTTAANILI